MSVNHQAPPLEQSPGCDPKASKRNSGLFSFFKWFKPSTSRESVNSDHSSSCDSLSSIQSGGTTASFSFVPPNAYPNNIAEKCINPGPETDTYKARLKQRDKRRENDKNLTLRKKYNLFFNRDTLLKNVIKQQEENTKSLPLMTKAVMEIEEDKVGHRRTNSESSKIKKAGAYLHVKGKRKAPQPPKSHSNPSTMSLRKKKRVAPLPPEKVSKQLETDIIFNDSLKLDHGILKPAKDQDSGDRNSSAGTSARSSYVETPVSPRPWYKRQNTQKDKKEKEHKYELAERLPETQILRNSTLDLTLEEAKEVSKVDKKKEEKRKSQISYLANISELDREACEIIKKEQLKNGLELPEMPEFMRPREESKINTDSWVSPKRRSARDLIAKFNAITNVTKVTVFGARDSKRDYFGKQHSLEETRKLENHRKRIDHIQEGDKFNVLMKSESASAIKNKPETPKLERKSWVCAKCNVENEYWRIICHTCSAIKPYFDDFYSQKQSDGKLNELKTASPLEIRKTTPQSTNEPPPGLERSKTQIGFSALANYNNKKEADKREEKEKLKKMLIEMKNSLPKRKSNILMKQNSRTSIIIENPENETAEPKKETNDNPQHNTELKTEKTQEQKVAEILIGAHEKPKPLKVSSSAQTNAIVRKTTPDAASNKNFELMRPKDFEDIYSDKNSKSAARIYANLTQSDELSLFFNVPKRIRDLKSDINQADTNTDTIEINRLLRRLETAIAKGDLTEAASFAKELAQLKVNCSVMRRKDNNTEAKEKKVGFQIEMYVEDKISHRGPFPIHVTEQQTVAELKKQIEKEFEIPADVQRWILGKELVTDDNATLKHHNVTAEGCPVFLYLVAPDKRKSVVVPEEKPSSSKDENHTPKIVDVIPKLADAGNEVKVSQIQEKTGIKETTTSTNKPSSSTETNKPLSTTETKLSSTTESNKLSSATVTNPPSISTITTQSATKTNPPSNSTEITKKLSSSTETNKPSSTTTKLYNSTETKKLSSSTETNKLSSTTTTKPYNSTETNKLSSSTETNKLSSTTTTKPYNSTETNKLSSSTVTSTPSSSKVTTQSSSTKISPPSNSTETTNKLSSPTETNKQSSSSQPTKIVKSPEPEPNKSFESKMLNVRLNNSVISPSRMAFLRQEPVKSELNIASITSHPPVLQHKPIREETIVIKVERNKPGTSTALVVEKQATKAVLEEDFEEYESKTLKANKEWECHLCTLLNPVTNNVCAVCATVRIKAAPRKSVKTKKAPQPQPKKDQTYLQLVDLDSADLVENVEPFECVVCFLDILPKEGVTLRECLHQFCKLCLAHTIEYTEDAEVKCPYRDEDYSCNLALQDREIKALVTRQVYDQFLAKSIAQAENKIDKSFHCKTPDCKGWCIFEDNVNEFRCPVCTLTNCLTCQAIHMGLNCKQYQERMSKDSENDEDARRTKEMLNEMVTKGEALNCPTCKVVLMKKWGCDWLRCSMCKTEICWVTRGPRWGPGGKGDTSAGCQCGVNGVKCHPKCNYCH